MLQLLARIPGIAKKPDHLYREVLADAFKLAWNKKRFWPLAFFASVLLTMGSYDVVYGTAQQVPMHAESIQTSGGFALMMGDRLAESLFGLQVMAIGAVLILAIGAFSCICQGGLVFALGAIRRGDRPGLREALRIGTAAMWPVIALNALVLMTLLIIRFLTAFAFYLVIGTGSDMAWAAYVTAYVLFMALSFVAAIVQIFALNALILQGAPVGVAIVRGYELFKKHWLVTLETALLLLGVAFGATFAMGLVVIVLLVPFTVGAIATKIAGPDILFDMVVYLGAAVIAGLLFAVVSFLTQLQYATWTILYRKLGEGGIVPKLHRLYRDLTGTYRVPQA